MTKTETSNASVGEWVQDLGQFTGPSLMFPVLVLTYSQPQTLQLKPYTFFPQKQQYIQIQILDIFNHGHYWQLFQLLYFDVHVKH